ncbi:MAG: FKBP-type peptidyl-prolyl cis-trans isomerase [Ginsengibacter sp.]
MNKILCLTAAAFLLIASGCNEQKFQKDKDGSEYKIIRNEDGRKAVAGDYMQVNILAKYKDSVLFSSIESSQPRFLPFDTTQLPPYYKDVHEGDSLVIRQSTDSIIKYGQGQPFMQKGEFVYQTYKFVKLFSSKAAADSAAKTYVAAAKIFNNKKSIEEIEKNISSNDSLVKADDKSIQEFMNKNNLKGNKTKWGTYVVIDSAGTGSMIGENDVAVVNYTGRTFNDSTFDSNTQQIFGHSEPLYVDMSGWRVIPGWIDGLKLMQKGSKGKIIIPSYLAYGKNGRAPKIGPNENLIFDIKVTDIVGQDAYEKELERQQQQIQQQRQMMEQMQQQMQQQQQQKPSAPPSGK